MRRRHGNFVHDEAESTIFFQVITLKALIIAQVMGTGTDSKICSSGALVVAVVSQADERRRGISVVDKVYLCES